ncbi:MAG TPA: sugar ABC transporter permease [Polyangiaceae bacterium LLY-WYZ-15_(1-7)]|nr:ABC transporter [Myxococcales bacterium]MAT28295.1 ABC transporter [Sandaracinus sp.]HJK95017.1 sugar ABC transporter permease [Polyangiaceae bacterium LLY-WYZ-15_(1-7)]HJL05801.1 sugar ABC transporter permease [Polyangiaceae bacterium LLY-WYZ-15_(1-7)]HJL09895.1 sugar ABC transporter permease [Polyangiaceae bacterium LLY-WYZ-15_(1-7)]
MSYVDDRPSAAKSIASHAILIAAVVFALYPILWVISLAFSAGDAPEPSLVPLPQDPSLEHVEAVVGRTDDQGRWLFVRQLFNSLGVAVTTSLAAVAIATPAAYAMSRFRFVGQKTTMGALLATQMFPGVAAAIPLYLLLDAIGLIDTRSGLVLVYATSAVPFAIFQLRSAFDAIPKDLEEAAMVDGATRFGAFVRVVLPAARPALAVTFLFAFMTAWNEFILAATFLNREENFTLPVVLQRYVGEYSAQWGDFAAGAILVSVPVMALFYWLQRHLVGGLTSGGVKG